jgi:hypothetical protein
MKLTPKNEEFHKIKNVGYLRTSNGTAYGCFIGLCRYKTYKKEDFKRHLDTYHTIEGAGSREGYCQMCEKNNCGFGLNDEFSHMQLHHIDVPYEATHLILYSKINNELIRKARERRARNRELKEKLSLERTLALFDEEKEPDEIYVPQETVEDGDDDDDYSPESEPESDEEVIEEPEAESEDDDDIEDSASIASSDMESEELEEDNIPLADTSSDSENENRRRRNKSKTIKKDENKSENRVPCSQPSQSMLDISTIKKEEREILVHDIPQYMLQRIKFNIESNNGPSNNGPQFTESFTSAIKEMLQPEKNVPKNCFARKSTTIGFLGIEPKACSVRVKRLESCESLKKYLSEDESIKENFLNSKKDSIDSSKTVMPDIPTPPASEDSRDSMISPPMRAENQNKKLEESIEIISNKILSKITFPSLRNKNGVSESEKESSDKKSSPPLRVSLRQRPKSIAVSRNDELYYRDDDVENDEKKTKKRRASNYTLSVFDEKEEEIIEPTESTGIPKYSEQSINESSNLNLDEENLEKDQEKDCSKKLNESNKPDEATEISVDSNTKVGSNTSATLPKLKIRSDLIESSFKSVDKFENSSQISSQSTAVESQDVIEIISSQEEIETSSNLQSLYPWIDGQVSSSILKTKKCADILLSEDCLFSTYKCMQKTCSFFTTSFKAFKNHAEKHDGNHHFCSFCLYDGVSGKDLSAHLQSHDLDRYQCNICMYRASEKMFVEWHRKKFHLKKNVKIYKSPIQKLGVIRRTKMKAEIEQVNWEKFVKPYECKSEFFKNNLF